MKTKFTSSSHGSTAGASLSGFIICFVVLSIRNVEPAQFTVIGPSSPIIAVVGEDTELPCHLSPPMSAEKMEVRWFRSHPSSLVYLYNGGKNLTESQIMPEYMGRTEFLKDGIRDGSVALRLRNIRPSDDGQYTCYFQSTYFYQDVLLELKVAAIGNAPLIAVEGYQDGGVRVVCQSAGWYPEPQVFWRDLTGQHLLSLSEKKSQRDNGLFETQTSIIITETSNQKISCYIRSALLRQEKEAAIYIADPIFPKTSPWTPILCTVLILQFLCIGLVIYFFKTKVKKTEEFKRKTEESRWKKCLKGAVDVTLDSATANPHLIISANKKSVRLEETDRKLPADHEGFRYSPCVLGCERFTSGRHFWGVEVGRNGGWAVGVARESVRTKEGAVSLNPEAGVWAIERQWWGEFWGLTSPMTHLSLHRKPDKIRVSVDYDAGQVEFFNANNMAPFFFFPPVSFTGEPIRPFFRVGGSGAHITLCP